MKQGNFNQERAENILFQIAILCGLIGFMAMCFSIAYNQIWLVFLSLAFFVSCYFIIKLQRGYYGQSRKTKNA